MALANSDELKAQLKKSWAAAAVAWEKWDTWFDSQSGEVTEWLCRRAELGPGKRVLDLACGSGQPSVTAATRVSPGGSVVATDLSPEMVAVAQRKARAAGADNIEFREMDAEVLDFADQSFDAVTCRFGLMFCPDPVRAAREIHRVLRPGGRATVAVWAEAARNPFFTLLADPVARFCPTPPPDPRAPGVFRLAPPGELEATLRGGGFTDVVVESWPVSFLYSSRDHYWDVHVELSYVLRNAVQNLSPAEIARLRDAVLEQIAPYVRADGRVCVTATPICAVATR